MTGPPTDVEKTATTMNMQMIESRQDSFVVINITVRAHHSQVCSIISERDVQIGTTKSRRLNAVVCAVNMR
jgi:hypothetical protein